MSIVQQYVSAWRPDELAALPEKCRPEPLAHGDDVALYAFRLVRTQYEVEPNHALDQMAAFFSVASQRLSFLMAHAQAFPAEQRALLSSRRGIFS